MKITLAEGVQLISQLEKLLGNYYHKLEEVHKVSFLENNMSNYKNLYTDEVDYIVAEITQLNLRLSELRQKIMFKNTTTLINAPFKEGQVSIFEGINLAKSYRKLHRELATMNLGATTTPKLSRGYGANEGEYYVSNFDVKMYEEHEKNISKKINRLSTEIDKANYSTYIDVEWASDYM